MNDKYIESMIEEMELRELELQQISIDDCFEDVIYAIEEMSFMFNRIAEEIDRVVK